MNLKQYPLHRYLHIICIVVIGYISFWMFSPGMNSPDTDYQWSQAVAQQYSDDHPPIMAWWWGVLNRYTPFGLSSLLLFHMVLFWSGIYFFGRGLAEGKSVAWRFIPIAMWFMPPLMGMSISLWKDTGMACSWFAAAAIMYDTYARKRSSKCWVAILLWLLIFYGTNVRHNAITSLPALCFAFAYIQFGDYGILRVVKWAKITLISILCFVSIVVTSTQFADAIDARKTNYSVRFYLDNLEHASHLEGKLLFPEYILKREGLTANDYPRFPSEASLMADPHIFELQCAYFFAIMKRPAYYLKARWEVVKLFLGFKPETVIWRYAESSYSPDPNRVRQAALDYLAYCALSWWYRPYIWIGGSFLLLALSLRPSLLGSARGPVALLNMSALMYSLPYFVMTPGPDFRYIYWSVVATILSVFILAAEWAGKRWFFGMRRPDKCCAA